MADAGNTPDLKICTRCKEPKPATTEFFRAEKRTKIGLQGRCRDCERAYHAARRAADPDYDRRYYEKNREELLRKQKEYMQRRMEERGDEVRAVAAAYRAKNRERCRAHSKAYYERNREQILEWYKDYYEANPDKKRAANERREAWRRRNRDRARSYVRNRRAMLRASPGTHTAEDIAKIGKGQRWRCWWCGCGLRRKGYEVDHRIPVVEGGSNGPENLVLACPPCNRRKNRKMPWELDDPRLL